MHVEVVTPSQITPWLLGDAKDHLRVRHSDDDGYITLLTDVVVDYAERMTGRALFAQTLRLTLDDFDAHEMYLPRPVLQSISSVKYYDGNGVLTTIGAADYQVDSISLPGRLVPAPNLFWPRPQPGLLNSVIIEYVAGYTSRGQLSPMLRHAMLVTLAHLYGAREPAVVGAIVSQIPYTIQSLYAPFRIWRFY